MKPYFTREEKEKIEEGKEANKRKAEEIRHKKYKDQEALNNA